MPHPAVRPGTAIHRRRPLHIVMLAAVAGCSSATAPVERVFDLEIADRRVPCVGVGPRECLQVREQANAPWQLFYAAIEGFTYEPGFRYVLRVAQRPVQDPPADASSLAYRLVEVVSKAPSP